MQAQQQSLTVILYSLFHCILNVRKVHVLLNKSSQNQACLPTAYIRSALPEIFAAMHVYFATEGDGLETLRGKEIVPMSPGTQRSAIPPNRKSSTQLEDAMLSSNAGKFKQTDYKSLFTTFVGTGPHGASLTVAVVRRKATENVDKEDNEQAESSSWEILYVKSNATRGNGRESNRVDDDSIFKQRAHGPNNLVRIIRENFSSDRDDTTTKISRGGNSRPVVRNMDSDPILKDWEALEKVLTTHSSVTRIDPVKYAIEETSPRRFARETGVERRPSIISNQGKFGLDCHVESITNSVCLMVVQGTSNAQTQRVPDGKIRLFLQSTVAKLRLDGILDLKVATHLKSELVGTKKEHQLGHTQDELKVSNNNTTAVSLWSESGWSDAQRKTVLHSLGLRRKNSPVMAPLKSPYVKRQMRGLPGRQRKKKTKGSLNHAHLDFFLGADLSRLI